nr:BON domain-containing protein [Oscillochloris sp. ZM17-4]
MESLDLRREREQLAGSTDDAYKASQEGLTYVPPTEEPYDEDRPRTFTASGDEVEERLRAALREDSRTAPYADSVEIIASASRVVLRGVVDDQAAAESLVSVAGDAADVAEVVNRLDVRALRHIR